MRQENGQSGDETKAPPHSFDWTDAGHVLVKASESMNWQMDDVEGFAKRVQSIEYGLSAETEFAAILSWLGRCDLVHKLDQDGYSSRRDRSPQIPDLLAVIEHGGHRVPMLIEVKTREKGNLAFKTEYLDGLRRYAQELRLPLLIAWKPRRLGFWLLVDPVHAKAQGGKLVLSIDDAAMNNLLGAVAGDFIVIPQPNCGLVFEFVIVKKTQVSRNGIECVAQLTTAGFQNASGERASNVPPAIIAMMFGAMEETCEVTDTRARKSFLTTGGMVHAQQILRASVAFQAMGRKPIRWRHVGKDLSVYLSREELNDAVGKNIGPFVKYQLFQHPQVWPEFLPESWNSLNKL